MENNMNKELKNSLNLILINAIKKSNFNLQSTNQLINSFSIEKPDNETHGDLAANVALVGAKILKMSPMAIAEQISKHIDLNNSVFERFEFVKPGFFNFFLDNSWYIKALKKIYIQKSNFGRSNLGKHKKVLVEFVSANPTGPMHVGNARGGVIGDCLAEIFSWAGFDVTREFYLNDAGNQIEKFKKSLSTRYLQLFLDNETIELTPDLYLGEDIIDLAKQFAEIHGDRFVNCNEHNRQVALLKFALPINIKHLETDLKAYRVIYNNWFKESELYKNDLVNEIINKLDERGYVYNKDGSVWFAFSKCGGEKDEVLIRSSGVATYFASDIAYHYDKFVNRKFDLAINVWGADHHGHVARLKGALEALGIDSNLLKIVLMQLVRLTRNGQTVKLSKRSGKSITLATLLDEIPIDAARFFFNLREASSHFDFDLNLAVEQTNNNPVFYVQYAYARICQILKKAKFDENETLFLNVQNAMSNYYFSSIERSLIKMLVSVSDEIENVVKTLNSSILAKFIMTVSNKFHKFYEQSRVVGDDEFATKVRLLICVATKIVLKNVASILKIDMPEKL